MLATSGVRKAFKAQQERKAPKVLPAQLARRVRLVLPGLPGLKVLPAQSELKVLRV